MQPDRARDIGVDCEHRDRRVGRSEEKEGWFTWDRQEHTQTKHKQDHSRSDAINSNKYKKWKQGRPHPTLFRNTIDLESTAPDKVDGGDDARHTAVRSGEESRVAPVAGQQLAHLGDGGAFGNRHGRLGPIEPRTTNRIDRSTESIDQPIQTNR